MKFGWCLVMPNRSILASYPVFGSRHSANNAARLAYKCKMGNGAIALGIYESPSGDIKNLDIDSVDFNEIQPITRGVIK